MHPNARQNEERRQVVDPMPDERLTPDVREELAQLALASEANADVGEELELIDRRLASWTTRSPRLTQAIQILRSNITTWRRTHDWLAKCTMDHAHMYEDEMSVSRAREDCGAP